MKNYSFLYFLIMILGILSCADQKTELSINEQPKSLELFGEGIVSSGLYERDIAITPEGDEIIYTLADYKQTKRCLVSIRFLDGKWLSPQILNISGEYHDIEPFFADGGSSLYFASNRPINENSDRNDYNIWYSKRNGGVWEDPIMLDSIINTGSDEFYPSLTKNGNLYFTATREYGMGREDIFVSKRENGKYQKPEVLDSAINTAYYEFNAYVNPEENLIIFSSYGREDGFGGGDLYYSKKDETGKWTPAKNLGSKINSKKLDYCPFVDIERNNFYFTSERMDDIKEKFTSVDELINYSNKPQNGLGDIYRIGFDELWTESE